MKNVFLDEIIHQKKVYHNDNFTVVDDIDPLVDGHLLMFPNTHYLSLAAAGIDNVIDFVDNSLMKFFGSKQYMLAEKGCANLWTSIEGVVHAHAHIVPTVEDIKGLFGLPNIQIHENITDAIGSLNPNEQYLLWGQLGSEFYSIQPLAEVPKRVIRNSLVKQYQMNTKGWERCLISKHSFSTFSVPFIIPYALIYII